MRILLDNNIHIDLAKDFTAHDTAHCRDLGWQQLANGSLVREASKTFDIMITVDKNMRHQTSLAGVDLAVVVFDAKNNRIDERRRFLPIFLANISQFQPGTFTLLGLGG